MDADTNDIVVGLENTVTLDGQTTPTHSLPMGGFTHTNVGNATLRTNYAAAGQVVDGSLIWGGTSGGSANAQTIAITPAVTALVAGQTFRFIAGFSNTSAATLAVNATSATAIRKASATGPAALAGGEIEATNTYDVTFDGTYFILKNPTGGANVLRSYLAGLLLSTAGGSGTFGIAAGQATDSTNVSLMNLASAFTKTTASWALGTGNGGLDTGAIAGTTWYHVFLIQRVDTGVVDVLFSLSASAPSLPTNYTLFRRIGSMRTDGSSHWLAFTQLGDEFQWTTPITDVNVVNLGTGVTAYTLTVPPSVQVKARIRGLISNASTVAVNIFPLTETGTTASSSGNAVAITEAGTQFSGFEIDVMTNTSAQIDAVANAASTTLTALTHAWIDTRGRFA